MRLPIDVPIVVKNVMIIGPKGWVRIDLVLDSGAVFTAISWYLEILWKYENEKSVIARPKAEVFHPPS